ncbi:MarR family transcriptional regulator [Mediterraneibacter sp. NSJ-55]|uniref:MarR family transcriptional regulator n=1 Tax=Mediterraneibacter hominis TaxID=2763054 RepID=A0A923LI28_9FIRM|nr:MarR family transcriptional regulator [Mediterraneibacter hominis]MBC5688419.1 MarR family transcriptional regulator [Mediterraneibacter hominis]
MYINTEYWVRIRKIMKLYEEMLKGVALQYGLTTIETDIISFLQHNPGKDTAVDIVEFRMLSKGCVSKAVESLIQKGLLRRQQDERDRRKIHLKILKKCEPVMESIESVQEKYWHTVFKGFTAEEKTMYFQYNSRISQNVQEAIEGSADR